MQRCLLPGALGLLCMLGCFNARVVVENGIKDETLPSIPSELRIFEHDYANAPRRNPSQRYQQKSSPVATTSSQLASYWHNLVRNVRLPVPSITWNVTNPLANLFQANPNDYAPPIEEEEVHDDYSNYYTTSNTRRHKNKRRRNNKRHRHHERPHDMSVEEQQMELEHSAAQAMIDQYPTINDNVDLDSPMYFFDPNTGAYYAVQRVRALASYVEGSPYNPNDPRATIEQNHQPIAKPQISSQPAATNDNEDDAEDDSNLDEAEENALDKVPEKEFSPTKVEKARKNSKIEKERKNGKVEKKNAYLNEETWRNVLGTYMRDDRLNRQKQSTKEKRKFKRVQKIKPRMEPNYDYYWD